MNAQHTTNNVLIDLHTESQRDLLSNAGTTPAGIPPFHCHDGLDEVLVGSLRARPTAVLGRKQHAVLSFAQHTVETQQSGRLQNDGGTKDACRAHEQRTQPGDNPIRGAQVGRTLAPAIEDEQLVPDQHRFGDNGTESTGRRQSGKDDDHMNEQDTQIAHPGNRINTSETTTFQANLAIRHRQASSRPNPERSEGRMRRAGKGARGKAAGLPRLSTQKPRAR